MALFTLRKSKSTGSQQPAVEFLNWAGNVAVEPGQTVSRQWPWSWTVYGRSQGRPLFYFLACGMLALWLCNCCTDLVTGLLLFRRLFGGCLLISRLWVHWPPDFYELLGLWFLWPLCWGRANLVPKALMSSRLIFQPGGLGQQLPGGGMVNTCLALSGLHEVTKRQTNGAGDTYVRTQTPAPSGVNKASSATGGGSAVENQW